MHSMNTMRQRLHTVRKKGETAMKKNYENAMVVVILLENEDVLTESYLLPEFTLFPEEK